jgi:hypothetical protein
VFECPPTGISTAVLVEHQGCFNPVFAQLEHVLFSLLLRCQSDSGSRLSFAVISTRLVRGREVRIEVLAYLQRLLAGEAVVGDEFGDHFEVVVLSTREAPVEHARRRVGPGCSTICQFILLLISSVHLD